MTTWKDFKYSSSNNNEEVYDVEHMISIYLNYDKYIETKLDLGDE